MIIHGSFLRDSWIFLYEKERRDNLWLVLRPPFTCVLKEWLHVFCDTRSENGLSVLQGQSLGFGGAETNVRGLRRNRESQSLINFWGVS